MGEQIKHVSRWTRPRTPLLLLPLEHLFYCPLVRFLPAWDERRVFPLSASVCLCPRPHAPARARAWSGLQEPPSPFASKMPDFSINAQWCVYIVQIKSAVLCLCPTLDGTGTLCTLPNFVRRRRPPNTTNGPKRGRTRDEDGRHGHNGTTAMRRGACNCACGVEKRPFAASHSHSQPSTCAWRTLQKMHLNITLHYCLNLDSGDAKWRLECFQFEVQRNRQGRGRQRRNAKYAIKRYILSLLHTREYSIAPMMAAAAAEE